MADCKCIVDQKIYKYCPNCDKRREPWRALYCSENCKDIYAVIEDYAFGRLDAYSAKVKLENLDLSNKDNFKPTLAKHLANINKAESPKVVFNEPVIQVVEEPKYEKKKTKFLPKNNVNEIETTEETKETIE